SFLCFFFSSRRRHTRFSRDWSSDVCSSDLVFIDAPTLPSVPYHSNSDLQPMDIPVFKHSPHGKKELVPLSDASRIVGVLQTFMNLVRVYTKEPYRARVETASRQILGERSHSGKISSQR